MTWKEFKEEVEKAGVKENMEIEYIDISWLIYAGLNIHIDEDNSFSISA